eukprot:6975585-Lingulodinium_polyedra.AAC.1
MRGAAAPTDDEIPPAGRQHCRGAGLPARGEPAHAPLRKPACARRAVGRASRSISMRCPAGQLPPSARAAQG